VVAIHDVRGPAQTCLVVVTTEADRDSRAHTTTLTEWLARRSEYAEWDAKAVFADIVRCVVAIHKAGVTHRTLRIGAIEMEEATPDQPPASPPQAKQQQQQQQQQQPRHHHPPVVIRGMEECCETDNYAAMACPVGVGDLVGAAPEMVLLAEGALKRVTQQVDSWSLGVVLHTMLCGAPPFTAESLAAYRKEATCGRLAFAAGTWRLVSPDAKDLVRCMLTVDPWRRIKPEDILRH
jgi:serine/threonine protein kinase